MIFITVVLPDTTESLISDWEGSVFMQSKQSTVAVMVHCPEIVETSLSRFCEVYAADGRLLIKLLMPFFACSTLLSAMAADNCMQSASVLCFLQPTNNRERKSRLKKNRILFGFVKDRQQSGSYSCIAILFLPEL